jgi:hypothetical protein
MPIHTVSSVGSRRFFPAWIDSDSGSSALHLGATPIPFRVRAALPLRRVMAAATTTFNSKLSDARRLR